MFNFDSVSKIINSPPNSYVSETHLKVQAGSQRNLNSFMLAEKFQEKGVLPIWTGKSRFYIPGSVPHISFAISHLRNFAKGAPELFRHKDKFKKLLESHGVSVSSGEVFDQHELDEGWRYISERPNVKYVVKPSCGHKGKGVTVGIGHGGGYDDFSYAWRLAVDNNRFNKKVVVEEQFLDGVEARFLVVGGKFVSAYRRIPPIVCGDGVKSIKELIEEKNSVKRKNPHQYTRLIKLDKHRERVIGEQGYKLSSVPDKGDFVLIDYKSSASTGADTVEISNEMHKDYVELVEKISHVSGDVPVLGIDIISKDFSTNPDPSCYVVLEANIAPGLGGHIYPSYGSPAQVIESICNQCFELSNLHGNSEGEASGLKRFKISPLSGEDDSSVRMLLKKLRPTCRFVGEKTVLATELEVKDAFRKSILEPGFSPSSLFVESLGEDSDSGEPHAPPPLVQPAQSGIRIIVTGKVVGVGFRRWLQGEAKKRGLYGWVRNVGKEKVESVMVGGDKEILCLLSICLDGPGKAQVDNVSVERFHGQLKREGFLRRKSVT